MSPPAQKARPAPVRTTARTSGAMAASRSASFSLLTRVIVRALSESGRLSVSVSTPSARLDLRVSSMPSPVAPPRSEYARQPVAALDQLAGLHAEQQRAAHGHVVLVGELDRRPAEDRLVAADRLHALDQRVDGQVRASLAQALASKLDDGVGVGTVERARLA